MSAKGILNPYPVITAEDMSADITSLPSVVTSLDNIAYQVVYTGSPVGVFNVEASLDGTNWTVLVFEAEINTTNSPSPFLININQLPYAQVRLTYTADSGSGSLSAMVMAKRLGG
jgi:hypothetical protein